MVENENSQLDLEYEGSLKGHGEAVTCLQYGNNKQGKFLVSGSKDMKIFIWNLFPEPNESTQIAEIQYILEGHEQGIRDIELNSTNEFALSASSDNRIRLWNLGNNECMRVFEGHSNEVTNVVFSGDDRQILSSSLDQTIKLWNTLGVLKYTIVAPCEPGDSSVNSCLIAPTVDKEIFLISGMKEINIYDRNLQKTKTIEGVSNSEGVSSLSFSSDENQISFTYIFISQ